MIITNLVLFPALLHLAAAGSGTGEDIKCDVWENIGRYSQSDRKSKLTADFINDPNMGKNPKCTGSYKYCSDKDSKCVECISHAQCEGLDRCLCGQCWTTDRFNDAARSDAWKKQPSHGTGLQNLDARIHIFYPPQYWQITGLRRVESDDNKLIHGFQFADEAFKENGKTVIYSSIDRKTVSNIDCRHKGDALHVITCGNNKKDPWHGEKANVGYVNMLYNPATKDNPAISGAIPPQDAPIRADHSALFPGHAKQFTLYTINWQYCNGSQELQLSLLLAIAAAAAFFLARL